MRKNTRDVFNSWVKGKSNQKQKSIWTDSSEIWSYQTIIVSRSIRTIVLNKTKYSHTTSAHQNALHVVLEKYCRENNLNFVVANDIPMRNSGAYIVDYLGEV